LLHGSIEHLVFDIKNIKETLRRMQKYILDKAIKGKKANNIKDLEGVGKAAWEFISSLYEAYWDNLFVDDQKTLLRNKVKSKFSPQAFNKPNNNKEKNIVKPPYVSSLPPSILTKSLKEINKISKFFKKNPSSINNKKSYAQASSNSSNTARETLKIKKAFSSLQNKKIKQVQKIISREDKLKPCINMTTKRPSCKQVIILMSTNNTNNFIKESNIHVANINRLLKNIKSDVMADFICIKNKDVVISTNKVANPLDLQTIKIY